VQLRFLLGPAGTGKTFSCLAEARQELLSSVEGPPLLFVAPKQSTYELERRLLSDPDLPGYTRLKILSPDHLAKSVFGQLGLPQPNLLEEEGRLMVLRNLISRRRDDLKLFRASARLTGFARQLSLCLRELQSSNQSPDSLRQLAERVRGVEGLAGKLHDLALLLDEYNSWLESNELQDSDCLASAATIALTSTATTGSKPIQVRQIWVDGFVELAPRQLDLIFALLPFCRTATITFCLDRIPAEKVSLLPTWSACRSYFEECRHRADELSGTGVHVDLLERRDDRGRFQSNPTLSHLERHWAQPRPFKMEPCDHQAQPKPDSQQVVKNRPTAPPSGRGEGEPIMPQGNLSSPQGPAPPIRLAQCRDPEAEVVLAAREILRHVCAGGRFRETGVLVRDMDSRYEMIRRVFTRYEIPFFLDRRESVSHHPLAELTRNALRTVAMQWQHEDWFAALKTGLVPAEDKDIDLLENEALARGWKGADWRKSVVMQDDPELTAWLAAMHRQITPPFLRLELAMADLRNRPSGEQLAQALRNLWSELGVEPRLEEWSAASGPSPITGAPQSIHATVWDQMNAVLENLELAFRGQTLTLRDWIPILDAGLSNLSVGVIPPALDQVLVGAVDRSRNPDLKLAILLGWNESVFPAPPQPGVMLTDADRLELERQAVPLSGSFRRHMGRERFYAYLACTRASHRLVITHAAATTDGVLLNPSPFLSTLLQLFPSLEVERVSCDVDWHNAEHPHELIPILLQARSSSGLHDLDTAAFPALAQVLDSLAAFKAENQWEKLAPEKVLRLYGSTLHTSVSRLEQFAACPFKFFVHSGMKAEERKLYELDAREQGTFQHDVLMYFHRQLVEEHKRWRDIEPEEARRRIATIAAGVAAEYREGLLLASEQSRFTTRVLTEALQDFIETAVGWMRDQYQFDPVAVELPFGERDGSPPWIIPIADGRKLALRGRIDRVDLCRETKDGPALCVVVDYKSSARQLDRVLLAHGLQLQLLAYLSVLRHWPDPSLALGVEKLAPVGVFYVNLRGKYEKENNRREALLDPERSRKLAYRHSGRFDVSARRWLDSRKDAKNGDQFNYRLKNDGDIRKDSPEALQRAEFNALLNGVEENVRRIGREIYSGVASVDPFRKDKDTACDFCEYSGICRIDQATHRWRVLRK
jgi:ATP-dependent helicase/nuclease subunit B